MDCNLECLECLEELCVHKIPLFSTLNRDDFEEIAHQMSFRKYRKGETILAQGSVPHAITIIRKGSAKACRITPDGQEKILYIFTKNDYFGEQYLFGDQCAAYTVIALERVHTCSFSKEHFQELIKTHPALAQKFIEELGRRVIQLENTLQKAGSQTLDAKIAALLLEFSEKYSIQTERGLEIILPISREGVANYLGVARETLSRKLNQLEDKHILHSYGNKRILLLNADYLKQQAFPEEST